MPVAAFEFLGQQNSTDVKTQLPEEHQGMNSDTPSTFIERILTLKRKIRPRSLNSGSVLFLTFIGARFLLASIFAGNFRTCGFRVDISHSPEPKDLESACAVVGGCESRLGGPACNSAHVSAKCNPTSRFEWTALSFKPLPKYVNPRRRRCWKAAVGTSEQMEVVHAKPTSSPNNKGKKSQNTDGATSPNPEFLH